MLQKSPSLKGRQEERKEQWEDKNQSENNNNGRSKCLSIITLNVHELNTPIRRQTVDEWIKKEDNDLWPIKKEILYL